MVPNLCLEDVLAATRAVAAAVKHEKARPVEVARAIVARAALARDARRSGRLLKLAYGDGSISAAAASVSRLIGDRKPVPSEREMLRAGAVVCRVLAEAPADATGWPAFWTSRVPEAAE
jgi:hypothetical protein